MNGQTSPAVNRKRKDLHNNFRVRQGAPATDIAAERARPVLLQPFCRLG